MFAKQNDNSTLKLIDFGLSAKYNNTQAITFHDKVGTEIYMAPEVFANSEYSKVYKFNVFQYVDLWSIGLIMYITIAAKHPLYENGDDLEIYLKKLKNPNWNFPPHFSKLAQSLFLKLVKANPLERYTAKEALGHPWITRKPGMIPLTYTEAFASEHLKTSILSV